MGGIFFGNFHGSEVRLFGHFHYTIPYQCLSQVLLVARQFFLLKWTIGSEVFAICSVCFFLLSSFFCLLHLFVLFVCSFFKFEKFERVGRSLSAWSLLVNLDYHRMV